MSKKWITSTALIAILVMPSILNANPLQHASAYHVENLVQFSSSQLSKIAYNSTGVYAIGDGFIAKYDKNTLIEIWNKAILGRTSELTLYSGSIFTVGDSINKFSSTGIRQLNKTISSPSGFVVTARSIAVDSTGIYVGGDAVNKTADPNMGAENIFVRKYSLGGNAIWTKIFALTSGHNAANAIAIDSTGLYVAGKTGALTISFLLKLDRNGNEIWKNSVEMCTRDSKANDLLAASGLVFMAGNSIHCGDYIQAYFQNGTIKWGNRYGGSESAGRGIAGDSTGVYYTGRFVPHDEGPAAGFVAKFGLDGKMLWSRMFWGESLDRGPEGKDITIGGGSVFVIGGIGPLYGMASDIDPESSNFMLKLGSNNELKKTDYNGDGYSDLAIGVSGEDLNTSTKVDAGAVNVIYGSSSGLSATSRRADQLWTQDSSGIEGASEVGDSFGASVASGDFNNDGYTDLAIGAPNEDIQSTVDCGSVNIIYGSSNGLSATAVLFDQIFSQGTAGVLDSCESGDHFGQALAPGDFDSDGYADLAIGVYGEDIGSITDAGALSIIYGSKQGLQPSGKVLNQFWSQDATGIEDSAESLDYFGWSLASGDFNGDGFSDLGIGAYGEDNEPVIDDGAVHVIYGSLDGLSTQFLDDQLGFDFDSVENGEAYGYSLTAGNFNGDTSDDLSIGVPFRDVPNASQGTVATDAGVVAIAYGSVRFGVELSRNAVSQYFSQDSPSIEGASESGDNFGMSQTAGDFNNDSFDDLAIGAPNEAIGSAVKSGSVNIIYGNQGQLSANPITIGGKQQGRADQIWSQDTASVEDVAEAEDKFGSSITAGDFNKDGRDDLAIGVPLEDVSGLKDVGIVNVIYGSTAGLSATTKADQLWNQNSSNIEDSSEPGDSFGSSLISQ